MECYITKATNAVGVARLVAVIVLAAMVMMACGGGENPPSTGQSQPKYGGTLVAASSSDPGLLNPAITSSGATHPVTGQIFNGLVRLYGADFRHEPDLARSWDVSPDGLTYTFRLQQGRDLARWSAVQLVRRQVHL